MNFQNPNTLLMVFCKAPIPGQVKTRLLPDLSPEQAAELHIELSHNTLRRATAQRLCPVQLWCSPSRDHAFFTEAETMYSLTLKQQQGRDLGERMHEAFCSALGEYEHALLIGCDCPSLTGQDLQNAVTALERGKDAVLAPAEDGGYVLIGLSKPCPELFENMPWGTDSVLSETRARLIQLKLICFELPMQWDLDIPEDLRRYRRINQAQN